MARTLVKVLDTEMQESKKGPVCHVTLKSPGDQNPFVCTVWSGQVKENYHLIYEQNVGKHLMCDIQFELNDFNGKKEFRTSFAMGGMAVPFESFIRQEAAKIKTGKPAPVEQKAAS